MKVLMKEVVDKVFTVLIRLEDAELAHVGQLVGLPNGAPPNRGIILPQVSARQGNTR
jgi:hypothetical protein